MKKQLQHCDKMIAECTNEPISQYNINVITHKEGGGDIINKCENISSLPQLAISDQKQSTKKLQNILFLIVGKDHKIIAFKIFNCKSGKRWLFLLAACCEKKKCCPCEQFKYIIYTMKSFVKAFGVIFYYARYWLFCFVYSQLFRCKIAFIYFVALKATPILSVILQIFAPLSVGSLYFGPKKTKLFLHLVKKKIA